MSSAVLLLCLSAASPLVDQADEAFRAGRYQEVLPLLDRALEDAELPVADQVRAHALAALVHSAFDRPTDAIAAYEKALEKDPAFHLDDSVSPKVRALYDEAKKNRARKAAPPPQWIPQPPPPPPPAEPERSLIKSPWLWGGVGVVAVAAGVLTGVLVVRAQLPNGNLPNGQLR